MRTRTRTRPPHPFHAEHGLTDWRGTPLCGQPGCGLPRGNAVHEMPPNPAAEEEARRTGEREEAG